MSKAQSTTGDNYEVPQLCSEDVGFQPIGGTTPGKKGQSLDY